MPNIRIFEQDNTGSSAVEDLAVVFIPGDVAVKDNVQLDANNCVYIPSTANIEDYFEINFLSKYAQAVSENKGVKIDPIHMIQHLIGLDYGIIYMYVDPNKSYTEYTYTQSVIADEEEFTDVIARNTLYIYNSSTGKYSPITSDATFDENTTYYTRSGNTYTGWNYYREADNAWDFLNDKNAYNVKFITTGLYGTIPVSIVEDSSSQETSNYEFDFTLPNLILPVCGQRKDCALLVDLNYYNDTNNESIIEYVAGNLLAADYKVALQYDPETISNGNALIKSTTIDMCENDYINTDVSSRAYSLVSNATMEYSSNGQQYTLLVPSSFVYLNQFASANNTTTNWLPISGVTRGVVEGTFTPDLSISKYYLDNEVITDGEGVSFNGIVTVRPYGYTIWGDRTLIAQDGTRGVQATSYMSLRNLISDIAKTVYNSAIRYTYETNNDITWMNFKTTIVTLLDQMVSSGVLQTYKIGRRVDANARNKMICIITLYPNLPVENFDVYINLENATVTTTEDTTVV